MSRQKLLAKPWMRIVLFLWAIVFPIVFVALPAMKMVTGEAPWALAPLWAFGVWALSPLAVSIFMKYWGGAEQETGNLRPENEGQK